jgi:hypothetical protein
MRRALAHALARLAPPSPMQTVANMMPRASMASLPLRAAGHPRPGSATATRRLPRPLYASISSSAASKKDKVVYECGDCGVQLAQKKGCCPECGAWGR